MSINDIHKKVQDADLSQDEEYQLRAILDPAVWAETTLRDPDDPMKSLKLREYQKDVLYWQPKKTTDETGRSYLKDRIKSYRMGRRVGKTISLAVEALWKGCTNHNYKILYIAPFESQCELFFNIVDKLLTNTQIVPERFVRKPYICEFRNGSTIRAHTANVRSSRKGSTIRGAEGDLIIIDEMDHGIDEVINEVVMPIYLGNDTACIIGSSTPTGRRGLFYLWNQPAAEKELGIKSFHYPSQVSPKWTPEAEKLAKAQLTRDQYIHEILAEFGEAMEGVFKNKDLDNIMRKYNYSELKYDRANNIYIMGVDWNETFGTCIVIIERNKKTKQMRLFLNEIVPKQEFTQLQGVDRIIKLHEKHRCDFVYVDKGFGTTQVELLKKYGMEHMFTGLSNIVKPIDYGGKVTVRDPATGQKVDKPAKPFLVNNAVLFTEARNINIPEGEDSEYGIIGQMRNFRVAKLSQTGHPIYEGKLRGEDNDHSLNALMLALCGYTLEYGELGDYKVTTQVAHISNIAHKQSGYKRENVEANNLSTFRNLLRRSGNFRENYNIIPGSKKITSFIQSSKQQAEHVQNVTRKRALRKLGGGRDNI